MVGEVAEPEGVATYAHSTDTALAAAPATLGAAVSQTRHREEQLNFSTVPRGRLVAVAVVVTARNRNGNVSARDRIPNLERHIVSPSAASGPMSLRKNHF